MRFWLALSVSQASVDVWATAQLGMPMRPVDCALLAWLRALVA
jgi:hypothetical protein